MNPSQDEQVLLVVHKHWASFVQSALFIACPGALIVLFLLVTRSQFTDTGVAAHALLTLLVPLTFLILWIILCAVWTMYYLDALVVTDRRIFYAEQQNMVNRSIAEWDIEGARVGVSISGVLQSLFKYGTLTIETAGQEPALIPDIPDPERVSAVILKQDDRFGQLQDTTRKQEELLKFLSHEVKGHLTTSKAMFAGIVEGDFGPISPTLDTMAHSALADTQKGVDTVMSILDNSSSQSGDLSINTKPFDLSASVRRIVEEFRPAATTKHLSLVTSIENGCTIDGDEEKIERHVLRNFLDNAIRYTPAGQIDVEVEKINGMGRISVSDTGIGIDPNDMQRLFTQGGHGEHSKEVNPESTGYGLFIAKQIVEKQGGRIWARSRGPSKGSTFFAEFPLVQT
jgi:signal transduction histidine kinase